MRVLITGASGMIGSTLARVIAEDKMFEVTGVGRRSIEQGISLGRAEYFQFNELSTERSVGELLSCYSPDVIINCAGLTKHYPEGNEPIPAIKINALLPHLLATAADEIGARLVQVSSDCVFDGKRGFYSESDHPNANDIYGRTKALGEVTNSRHITLRTSTIGHENQTCVGLLEWFLAQTECRGFSKAIFSGLPTVEFARVVRDFVLKNSELNGLYNVGAEPIDKASLLALIAQRYGHTAVIHRDESFVIDRSLNSRRFNSKTGYNAPPWLELVDQMYTDFNRGN